MSLRVLEGTCLSDQGPERPCNEDRAAFFPELGLALVIDGMGGEGVGDRVADLILETIVSLMEEWHEQLPHSLQEEHPLLLAIQLANLRVLEVTSAHRNLQGGGATVISAQTTSEGVRLTWVGDMRGYLWRQQHLRLLTPDIWTRSEWTLTEENQEELFLSQQIRALGQQPQLRVQAHHEPALPGDLLLLCSDGLYGAIEDQTIAACLAEAPSDVAACTRLVREANETHGFDNVSLVLIRWPL